VLAKRLPRYPVVPATLMGRLAVHQNRQGQGLGELLLFDAFSRTLRSDIASYAFVVDAKDDAAQAFYQRYDFMPLASGGRRLFLPLAEIAMLFR
jgi:predicted GNAT family N-acyltransferase